MTKIKCVSRKGAKSKKNPANVATVLRLVSAGVSFRGAAGAVGIDESTLHMWRREDESFAQQVEQARAECLRLRVKDIDLTANQIEIHDGKGMKDRVTMLPLSLKAELERHLAWVKSQHEADLRKGGGEVHLPFALERKYPKANREWRWQYVFPAKTLSSDPVSGKVRRHHWNETTVQRAIKVAVQRAGLNKQNQFAHVAAFICDASFGERV